MKTQDTLSSDSKHESHECTTKSLQYCCVPGANCVYNGNKRYDALDTTLRVGTVEEDEKHHDCEPYNLGKPIVLNQDEPLLGTPSALSVFIIGTRNIVRLFMIDIMANDYMANTDRSSHLLRKKIFLSNIKDSSTDPNIEEI